MKLFDYIYVDYPKIISVFSQLTGGVVELRETSLETTKSADDKRRYDFRVFEHQAGGTAEDKSTSKEVVKPHHSLFVELEELLQEHDLLVDLTTSDAGTSLSSKSTRSELKSAMCVKVRGRAVIEDYARLKSIADVFPDVIGFVNKSIESNLRQSPEYIEIKQQIDEQGLIVKRTKDKNQKATEQKKLQESNRLLEKLIADTAKAGNVEQWILDGMRTWIDAFLPGIINLRVYPNPSHNDEHIFGHLKRGYFEDSDTNSFHFTYGSIPTEDLTMLGIVTSVPEIDEEEFSPMAEFERESLSDAESIESAFRGMFRGFDGLEQMIRTCRYPRILVYPLLVYRQAESNKSVESDT